MKTFLYLLLFIAVATYAKEIKQEPIANDPSEAYNQNNPPIELPNEEDEKFNQNTDNDREIHKKEREFLKKTKNSVNDFGF